MSEPTWNSEVGPESDALAAIAPASTPQPEPSPASAIPAVPAAAAAAQPRKIVFAGYTASQLILGVAVVAMLIWGMWVTRTIITPPQKIVKANLSSIVGDYVQAQAHSASPPQEVEAEMRKFMTSLDGELQRRSASGQVILVGEAVLSKGVEDITPDVMKAVYASGVTRPTPASAEQIMQSGTEGPIPQMPVNPPAPQADAAGSAFGPMPAPASAAAAAAPMADAASFGGPYGAGGQ
jgi:hypothetical protein